VDTQARTVIETEVPQLGFDGIGKTHQNYRIVGMLFQVSDCRGNGYPCPVVAPHGINGYRDIHRAILLCEKWTESGSL